MNSITSPSSTSGLFIHSLIAVILLFSSSLTYAKSTEQEWQWFSGLYDASANVWKAENGIAEVCASKEKLIISLFRSMHPTDSGALNQWEAEGKWYGPRRQGYEKIAEITGILRNKKLFLTTYHRWGTDEYGIVLKNEYLIRRHKNNGFEALTLYATGSMQFGLRQNLAFDSKSLFELDKQQKNCPLPEIIELKK